MTDDESPLAPGQVIDGKYRIEHLLGRGGIGIVAKAEHLVLKHPVALKVLRRELASDDRHVARFLREARAAVRLESEHVARVMDVGTLEDGAPYLVMEYLEGEDLAHRVERSGPLPPDLTAAYLLEACDGLAEAHAAGIIHTRRETGEPVHCQRQGWQRAHSSAGLRDRQGRAVNVGQRHQCNGYWRLDRLPALHVSRADEAERNRGSPHRHMGPRYYCLRTDDRRLAV